MMKDLTDYQGILFPYAYNILGSVDESQDVVQDVLLKYLQKGVAPENEKNYLIRSVINQSINKRKAKKRTETTGELPQPIIPHYIDVSAEMKDMVSYSLLVLLERLNPKERAVFILKEAFAYTHEEIAEVLSVSAENSRQILSRASKKVHSKNQGRSKQANSSKDQMELLAAAIQSRDLDQLHQLFCEDITFRADGGSTVSVVAKSLNGVQEVALLMTEVYQRFQRNYRIRFSEVNHEPAILYFQEDELKVCQIYEFNAESGKVRSIHAILDPDKLKRIPG